MDNNFNFLVYQTSEENVFINALIKDETIWLTQKAMAELFDVNVPAISKHLQNIFDEGELEKNSTASKMETVQQEGNALYQSLTNLTSCATTYQMDFLRKSK